MSERVSKRLAVDIGGTFTDVVLETGERTLTTKVLTTPKPERGVLDGVAQVLARADHRLADIDLLIHGTTLATNAIIERKGARTAFITTHGFRDTLEIGDEGRHDQYDLYIEKPAPLVSRALRLPVLERVSVHGEVLVALDEAEMRLIDGNPAFELYDFGYTDDLRRLIQIENFVTINNAMLVDLTGQVAAEIVLGSCFCCPSISSASSQSPRW